MTLQQRIYSFLRSTGGKRAMKGVSVFAIAAKALVKYGATWPDGLDDKTFVTGYFQAHATPTAPKKIKNKKPSKAIRKIERLYWEAVGGDMPTKKVKVKKPKPDVCLPEFLQSYAWRRVRLVALKKYGPKCQCCGATPETGAVMNVDHIKPRLKYPELALDVDNLQILCNPCNHGKGNWDETDWRK